MRETKKETKPARETWGRIVVDKQADSATLWAEARIAALRKRITVSAWVWDAIREKLARDKK